MNFYAIITTLLSSFLDIFLVAVIVYASLKLLVRSEKHTFLINGALLFAITYGASSIFNLNTLSSLLANVYSWGIIIIIILFQKEIRDSLEKFGSFTKFFEPLQEEQSFFEELNDTVYELSKKKVGALITIEGTLSLSEYTKNSVKVDSVFSKYLLLTIFNKEAPLHDGAVVISKNRIMYATTYFPIALDINVNKKYGTRHRAAITISKETDSLTIIVSEETGTVAIAYDNKLYTNVEKTFFNEFLREKLIKNRSEQ